MNVLVVEDEAPARRLVVRLLTELRPTWTVTALDSLGAVRASPAQPDLVLCDIRLSDGNALTLFEEGSLVAPVIFITAWDAYLMAAFSHLSVDYLLKPLERPALAKALGKFEKLQQHFGAKAAQDVAALTSRLPRQRVLVRYKGETKVLATCDIAYFKALDKLTLAVDREGRDFIVDRTLSQLESELDAERFFRVNRGWLVEVSAIKTFKSAGRGRIELCLAPEPIDEVLVSQERADAFRHFMDR